MKTWLKKDSLFWSKYYKYLVKWVIKYTFSDYSFITLKFILNIFIENLMNITEYVHKV